MPADVNLVKRFQEGDPQAFAALVNQYQGYIASVAYSATGDLAHSEDITQQAFLTAWQKQSELQDANKWLSWLRGITRNLLRNHYRSAKKNATTVENLDHVAGASNEPVEQCISSEQSELLWSVLERIPETYREPLVLFYREGKSVNSVAEMMGITKEAAKQRLARGRKLIKQEIATFVEDTLEATRPSPVLAAAIIASIPGLSTPAIAATTSAATTHTIAANSTSSAAATIFTSKFAMLLLGPFLGIAGAVLGCRASLKAARSEEERKLLWRMIIVIIAEVSVLLLIQLIGANWFSNLYYSAWLQVPIWSLHTIFLVATILVFNQRLREINTRLANSDPKFKNDSEFEIKPTSTLALRLNMLGTLVGSTCFLPICAALTGDWLILSAWIVFLAAICRYMWVDAPSQQSAGDQVRYNAKGILFVLLPLAGLFAIRGDYWLSQFPDQPQVPAPMVAVVIVVFGLALNFILQRRAANLDQLTAAQHKHKS